MPCYQCIWMETAGGIAHCPRTGRTIGLYSLPCPEFAPYLFNTRTVGDKRGISTGKIGLSEKLARQSKNCTKTPYRAWDVEQSRTLPGGKA